ncbi:MAG: hypothetical protein DRI52_10535, partial [Chloroflexi bacterium]
MKVLTYICSISLMGLTATLTTCSVRLPQPSLSRQEQAKLQMLSSQLTDRNRSKQARIEAAKLLLQRNYPQAIHILQERLIDNSDPTCQIAICQAIIQTGIAQKQFVAPLLAILKNSSNPAVRASAADALIVHKRFGSLDRMIELLTDRKTNPNTKITIISALSKTLDKRAVEALVVLTADRDKSVRH